MASHQVENGRQPIVRKRRSRVEIAIGSSVRAALGRCFALGARQALEARDGRYKVRIEAGEHEDLIVVMIGASHRVAALPLFFPGACALRAEDVARIIRNVIEGMGPGFGLPTARAVR